MKLNDFSKGLSTRLDATLIASNEARLYKNIDNTGGLLTSALSYTAINQPIEDWFYLFDGQWLSGTLERDYVEYQGKLYWSEADSQAKKWNGVDVKNLGISAPTEAPAVAEGAAGSLYGVAMPLPPGTGNDIVFSPLGTGFAVAHDTTPFITIYKQNGTSFEALDEPTLLPTGKAKAVAYSPDGNYLAVAHEPSPYLTVYKINNDKVTTVETVNTVKNGKTIKTNTKTTKDSTTSGKKNTKIAEPATPLTGDGWGLAWSADSVYLAATHAVSPYVSIYKLASDVLTKLANPATLPTGIGRSAAFSADTTYLAVAHTTTPFVSIYKRSGDVFTKLANPADLPAGNGRGVCWSQDYTYLAVAHETTPFITVWSRAADVFTKLADPADLPPGTANCVEFSGSDGHFAVGSEATPYITLYSHAAGTLTLLADPDILPAGPVNGLSWKNDDTQLGTAHDLTPFITLYERDVDTFTKYKDPTTLQYCYTYYDSAEGIESAPSPLSEELDIVAGSSVDLANILPSANSFVDSIRLYRIGADVSDFTLIVELTFATGLTDNGDSTYAYNDNIPTLDAVGDILDSEDNQPPLDGMINLVEAYGHMFASVGPKLVYCKAGQPDYWPTDYNINMSNDITGILPVTDGIFIFMGNDFEVLTGSAPGTFAKLPSRSAQGSKSHKSGKTLKGLPIWLSNDGFCTWQGGGVTIISKDKLGKLELNIINAVLHDETYYALLTDGTLFSMDMRFNSVVFKTYAFPDNVLLTDIGVFNDTLYGAIAGEVVTLFDGEELELSYLSPEITEGDASMSKMYNNVYIRANGEFTVKLYIDGAHVAQKDISGNDIFDLKVPHEKQRGSSIQFAVNGIGTVKEIEYKVVGRENGR